MDYNAPVARRTRLSEEKYWRKLCEKQAGERKLCDGSDKKEKSRKKSKEWDCVSLDDSEENEEASVRPSTGGKEKKKGGKRKSAEGSKKQRSGCDDSDDSDDGGAASVEIISESSFGKQDNDSVGFDHVESTRSNGKNSKSGAVDIENLCPVDVEDSDDGVVYLGEEKVEGFGCSSTERSDASEDDDDDVKSVKSLEFFPLPQEKNRRKPRSSSKPSSSSSSSFGATVKAANKFVSSHPFFKITLGSSREAHVPNSFRKHFTPGKNQTARLLVGDRSWPVTLIFNPKRNYRFRAGWTAFEKANWLKRRRYLHL